MHQGGGEFQLNENEALFYRYWKPQAPKGIIFCIHGLGAHSQWFAPLAEKLYQENLWVVAPDLRGFGLWQGEKGDITDFSIYLEDLEKFLRDLYSEDLPLFLLGESMGGLLSTYLAGRNSAKFSGMVLLSPAVEFQFRNVSHGLAVKILLSVIFTDGRRRFPLPIEPRFLVGNQEDTLKALEEDTLKVFDFSGRLLWQLLKHMHGVKKIATKILMPTLILQAGEDKVVRPVGSRKLYRIIPSRDKRLIIMPGAEHSLLNDVCKEEVYEKICKWFSRDDFSA